MAATYVQITRDEFEEWLNSAPWSWKKKSGTAGVYVLRLSDYVGVLINSTVGSQDAAMNRGKASGSMRLISLEHGHTLNKKAMGQSHFARTMNWRQNWKKGVQRIVDAYENSPSFYDAFAGVADRRQYQAEMKALIEAVPNWQSVEMLSSFHKRVSDGGILTLRQRDALDRAARAPAPKAAPAPQKSQTNLERRVSQRKLVENHNRQ
jgi:hypothetical protein